MSGATATAVAWRAGDRLYVTAIAKATFAFADDAFMPRVEPERILTADVHYAQKPTRSIQFTNDLAPYLARADVLFTGFANALRGGPVRRLPVRLAIQSGQRLLLDKQLLVQDASGFHRISMTYERAWGGIDCPENPLGIGAQAGTGEPNIVDPANPKSPAGFGPIGRLWPLRKRLLGAVSRKVLEGPIAEIPEHFDWSYYQAAPADQRVDYLRGDEWIVIEGMHPTLARARMRLPRVQAFARVHGLAASGAPDGETLPLTADTLRIDGEQQRCTLVFRASFTVPDLAALAALRITAGVESWGMPIVWRAPEAARAASSVALPAAAPGLVDGEGADTTLVDSPRDARFPLDEGSSSTLLYTSAPASHGGMTPAFPPGVTPRAQVPLPPPADPRGLPLEAAPPAALPWNAGFDPES